MIINKLINKYHLVMSSYNFTMYNDCLDNKLRESYLNRAKFHQSKI